MGRGLLHELAFLVELSLASVFGEEVFAVVDKRDKELSEGEQTETPVDGGGEQHNEHYFEEEVAEDFNPGGEGRKRGEELVKSDVLEIGVEKRERAFLLGLDAQQLGGKTLCEELGKEERAEMAHTLDAPGVLDYDGEDEEKCVEVDLPGVFGVVKQTYFGVVEIERTEVGVKDGVDVGELEEEGEENDNTGVDRETGPHSSSEPGFEEGLSKKSRLFENEDEQRDEKQSEEEVKEVVRTEEDYEAEDEEEAPF